jgi:hypothetical protein
MDKARILEQFQAVTTDVEVQRHDCPEDADDPVADTYAANSLPTLVFEEIATGRELMRYEGGVSLPTLRELYNEAREVLAGNSVTKHKKQAKQSASYEPRTGGYPAVVTSAESTDVEKPELDDEDEAE